MKRDRRGFLLYVLPALLFCAVIFVISGSSRPPAPTYDLEWGDKINHAGAFGLLMLLSFRAAQWLAPARSPQWRTFAALIFTLLYGVSDELHQALVPGRTCELADWLADAVGALLATGGILLSRNSSLAARLFGPPAGADGM